MEVSYARRDRREKHYSVIRCLGCHQPILVPLPLTNSAIVECEYCGKQQCVIYEFDHEMQRGQYRVLPGKG